MLDLAEQRAQPVVLFAEDGGGRPGDTDSAGISLLDVPTVTRWARLAGRVPTIAVVSGSADTRAVLVCALLAADGAV